MCYVIKSGLDINVIGTVFKILCNEKILQNSKSKREFRNTNIINYIFKAYDILKNENDRKVKLACSKSSIFI